MQKFVRYGSMCASIYKVLGSLMQEDSEISGDYYGVQRAISKQTAKNVSHADILLYAQLMYMTVTVCTVTHDIILCMV